MALASPKPRRRRNRLTTAATILGATALTVLGLVHLHHVGGAISRAPMRLLAAAAALQAVSIIARAEAWFQCVRAAGGTVPRRMLYRCSSLGFAGNTVNGGLGTAARIAALRRSAPDQTPALPALIAAELPVVCMDMLLGSLVSFTLIGPLGLPWWVPAGVVGVGVILLTALRRYARGHQRGIGRGLAALRGHEARERIAGLVALSMASQVGRTWLMLHAVGLGHVGPITAAALMVGAGVLGQLPIGPGSSAGAAVLILGIHHAAAAAASGVLLTATGVSAALGFMLWAGLDLAWRSCPKRQARLPIAADMLGAGVCGVLLTLTAVGVF